MNNSILIVGSAAASLIAQSVFGEEKMPDNVKKAVSNFQYELSQCIAFYSLATECVKDNEQGHSNGMKLIEGLTEQAILFGMVIGMTDDAIKSRILLEIGSQKKLINEECMNISSLLNRYGERCDRLRKDPKGVLEEFKKQ